MGGFEDLRWLKCRRRRLLIPSERSRSSPLEAGSTQLRLWPCWIDFIQTHSYDGGSRLPILKGMVLSFARASMSQMPVRSSNACMMKEC